MQKRVYIIHGWGGVPQSNWFPWLREELEQRGYQVEVPAMPDTERPRLDAWLGRLQEVAGEPNEHNFFVGHSLGVVTILRYLESLHPGQRIGGAVLVAGFSESIGIPELENFFSKPLDHDKVKVSAHRIIAIHSDNDPYIPLRRGEFLRDRLGAELIVVRNAGHLNAGDGFTMLPIVLEKILEISG